MLRKTMRGKWLCNNLFAANKLSDWLARVEASPARATPSLKEINALVHSIRRRGKR